MTTINYIGIGMLASLFLGFLLFTFATLGWKEAFIVWALIIALISFITLAAYLITYPN